MATAALSAPGEQLSEINTTPLIDVLLVLLVMLILTVPIATNSLQFDLPKAGPPPPVHFSERVNRLAITREGTILWNGDVVNRSELAAVFGHVRSMKPEPEVQFEPDGLASYELSANVLNQVKQAGLSKFGFAGTERYREFGRAD